MAKRLTPFIGLAVVAALALAAAFGAFSLSPAYAGVETPDARGLTVTEGFSPQAEGATAALDAPTLTPEVADTAFTNTPVIGDNAVGNVRTSVGLSFTVDLADTVPATAGAVPYTPDAYYMRIPDPDPDNNPETDDGEAGSGVLEITGPMGGGGEDLPIYTGRLVATDQGTTVTVEAKKAGVVTVTVLVDMEGNTPATGERLSTYTFNVVVMGNNLTSSSENPNTNTRYTLAFVAETQLDTGEEIIVNLEDFGLPSAIDTNRVTIRSDAYYERGGVVRTESSSAYVGNVRYNNKGVRVAPQLPDPAQDDDPEGFYQAGVANPTDVFVDGDDIRITVPDMNSEDDAATSIMPGDLVTIVIQQPAGMSNPSEGGTFDELTINSTVNGFTELTIAPYNVVRRVKLSEEDGGRGTEVTATGSGFKNGTTLGFFLDELTVHIDQNDTPGDDNNDNGYDDNGNGQTDETGEVDGRFQDLLPSGERETGEVVLCDVAQVGSNDVGSCTFTVSNPPFTPGFNYVGAVDGRGQFATKSATHNHGDQQFELKPSISVTPSGGNPGETILVQGFDFPQGSLTRVRLARQDTDAQGRPNTGGLVASVTGGTTVGSNGDISFRVVIPNWAAEGVQDLQVTAGGESDNVNITVGGPRITVTPEVVLANQRISLVGTGFTPSSRISGGTGGTIEPTITIGGFEIPMANINEGDPVTVDNGGKWSASLDMPLRDVTTRDGAREIRVSDSGGRSGTVDIDIPARSVTIDPASGRTGTTAIVRGENFPSRNDNGVSFNISIAYDIGSGRPTTVSTVSDASGRFEEEIRIPTSATIPSTNTVRVTFTDEENVEVTTTVTHDVPEGTLVLSQSSGAPGSTVTVRGEGFKTFVPIRSVRIGSIDVLPSPAPATDAQGMTEFDVLIPGLDSGIQTLEVEISDTTASIGFNVTTAAEIGAETRVAEGVANLGDNFVRAFHFSNDTKSWTLYDPDVDPASLGETAMNYFIAGSSYWILVARTEQVILNRKTRTLTCVDGNCWNLITW